MTSLPTSASSEEIRKRVKVAHEKQQERFKEYSRVHNNAMMPLKLIQKFCQLPSASEKLMKQVMERFSLSARAYNSIRKVARTIADLEGSTEIKEGHIAVAVMYRSLDRETWGD